MMNFRIAKNDEDLWLFLRRRLSVVVILLISSLVYVLTNSLLTHGYSMKTPWDDYIPIVPVFIFPYILFLPACFLAYVWAALKMDEHMFRAFFAAAVLNAVTIAMFYVIFPNYVERRQVVVDSLSAALLNLVYANDRVFNAFPSQHVYLTTLLFLFYSRWYPQHRWLLAGAAVTIILSTLLTGQHHIPDVIGGLILAYLCYRFGFWWASLPDWRRRFAFRD